MTKVKISAAILTFNSEKNIENVLNKLGWCDEIIIVDSYSTDKTLDICANNSCVIYQKKFEGFGSQKQFLISKCSNDWVISIDSDEVLDDLLIKSINELSIKDFENFSGFLINRKHIFLNRQFIYGKESKAYILRLFNKNKGNVTDNVVHESIKVTGIIKQINGSMLHYTISDLKDAIQKMDSYAQLKAKEYFTNKKNVTFIKLYLSYPFTFFKEYFINLNFLNGYEGYIWSNLVAQGSALKYYYLKELYKKNVL
jgi:glycosyltransferase involved in cell wall biosynthesis